MRAACFRAGALRSRPAPSAVRRPHSASRRGISTLCSSCAASAPMRAARPSISAAVYRPRCRLPNAASGMWGRSPSTGTPVSCSSMGARLRASMAEQSFSRMPAIWLGCRKASRPRTCAASVRLAPRGRSTSSTGRSSVRATCHALARAVTPPTPS